MTTILLDQAGKKFSREWIFRNLTYSFQQGSAYALTGPNGSGKSTLLQIISGAVPLNQGKLKYLKDDTQVSEDKIYSLLNFAAPYADLVEEFTLAELLKFHFSFKQLTDRLNLDLVVDKLLLTSAINKQVKYFSSGMKQRLKLGLAFFSQSPVILLDEPTTNLDSKGIEWYQQQITSILPDKLVIIASNQAHEYNFCQSILNISDYKFR